MDLFASDPTAHVVVHASAGSGKTKVLIDRLLRLALQGVPLDNILCITFTKAAAQEMVCRFKAKAESWLLLSFAALSQELQEIGVDASSKNIKQARLLYPCFLDLAHRLPITTLHSFCQSLLSSLPMEAQVTPHFSVIDDNKARCYLVQAIEETFEKKKFAQDIQHLFSFISPDALIHFMMHLGAARMMHLNLFQEAIFQEKISTQHTLSRFCEKDLAIMGLVIKELEQGSSSDQKHASALQEGLSARMKGNALNDYLRVFLTQQDVPRKNIMTAQAFFEKGERFLQAEAHALYLWKNKQKQAYERKTQQALLRVCQSIVQDYMSIKNTNGVLDYADLIFKLKQFFQKNKAPDWIQYKLGTSIHHILVDEAQDISQEQWQVLEYIWTSFFEDDLLKRVFLVGDPKQSIYGFQGAAPHLFKKASKTIEKLAHIQRTPCYRVNLDVSFRSAPVILKNIDRVFQDTLLQKEIQENVQHHPYWHQNRGSFQVWPLITCTDTHQENLKDTLAESFAEKVKEVLRTHTIFRENRLATPADIMILFQQREPWMPLIIQALKNKGLKVVDEDRIYLRNNPLTRWIKALCYGVVCPEDTAALWTIFGAQGPFYLSQDQIYALSQKKGSLSKRLKNAGSEKDIYFFQQIESLIHERASSFLIHVLDISQRFFPTCALFQSHTYAFEHLVSLVRQNENTLCLRGFLTWIETQLYGIKADPLRRKEIFCTTVHGAKGLQAPIVILADTTRSPPTESGLFWPAGSEFPWILPMTKERSTMLKDLVEKSKSRAFTESIRLLYVAMTRAQDHLILSGFQAGRSLQCWASHIQRALCIQPTHTFVDGEVSAYETHKTTPSITHDAKPLLSLPPKQKERLSTSISAPWQNTSTQKNTHATQKGIFAHALLLQWSADPDITDKKISLMSKLFSSILDEKERQQVVDMVKTFLVEPTFDWLRCGSSEVALCGIVDGQHHVGRIDRLVSKGNSLVVVEFKTGTLAEWEKWHDQNKFYMKLVSASKNQAYKKAERENVKGAVIWVPHKVMQWTDAS